MSGIFVAKVDMLDVRADMFERGTSSVGADPFGAGDRVVIELGDGYKSGSGCGIGSSRDCDNNEVDGLSTGHLAYLDNVKGVRSVDDTAGTSFVDNEE